MGNSVSGSKDRHAEEMIDFGFLTPQGVYTGSQDWNQQVVGNLIVDRKLAPFYRPLEEYDESWDDEHILAARKESPNAPLAPPTEPSASAPSTLSKSHRGASNRTGKEPFRPTEASVYRGAVECPICFLYYPPNINRSRCCDQSICTECFVQIKRAEPTTTHLVSEPAACPYCVQENFGITYDPPPWRTGLVRDGHQHYTTGVRSEPPRSHSSSSPDSPERRRRKNLDADSPEVVTIDQIRPDWEAKLAAVRAAVTRRANRRIIMRQIGDRLIPIGVTSGRVLAGEDVEGGGAEGADAAGNGNGNGRRRRRFHAGQDINQLLGSMGVGGIAGQDLEELMVMEAMRLSLLEHEEQQRRNNTTTTNGSVSSATPPGHGSSPEESPGISPAQSLRTEGIPSQNSSLLGPFLLGGRQSRPPAGQGSTLAAALAAAQTPPCFSPQSENRERTAPAAVAEGDAPPPPMTPEPPSIISATETPRAQPVSLPNTPSDNQDEATQVPVNPEDVSGLPGPSASSSPAVVATTPPTPPQTPGAEGAVSPASTSQGYVPLPSSSEMSDPILQWENK